MDSKERLPPKKKEIDCHNSIELCPKIINEDMKWFPFQGIMLHTTDEIKIPE